MKLSFEITLDRIHRGINAAMLTLAGIALLLMALSVFWTVLARAVPGIPQIFGGSVEFAGYMMIAVVYLGAGATLTTGGFLRVDLLFERMPFVVRHLLVLLAIVVGFVVTVLVFEDVFAQTRTLFQSGVTSVGNLEIPRYIPFAVLSAGLAILAIQLILMAAKLIMVFLRHGDADEIVIDHDAEDDLHLEGVI